MMTDDRNLTSHTYIEAVAEAIYAKLTSYSKAINALVGRIATNLADVDEAEEQQQ